MSAIILMLAAALVGPVGAQTLEQAGQSAIAFTDAARHIGEPSIRHDLKYREISGPLFVKTEGDRRAADASDIAQGEMGDCYFLSSLAAIAHVRSSLIHQFIHDNHDGTFTAVFHRKVGGKYQDVPVRVDDRFPEFRQRQQPSFAQPVDRDARGTELWVMAAEKAFAQFKGGTYHKIDGGVPSQAMAAILGMDSQGYRSSQVNFDQLAGWKDQGYPIVVGTLDDKAVPHGKDADPLWTKHILVSGHAYWVEKVDKRSRTVTIANPWGFDEKHVTLTEDQFHTDLDSVFVTPLH